MRRIAAAVFVLVLGACNSPAVPFVTEQIERKSSRQRDPKTLLTTGIAPNGLPYVLDVYRIDDGRICVEHAWQFASGSGAQASCTPDNHPRRTFQNWTTYPQHDDTPRDETPWLIGIVLDDGKAVTLRGSRGTQTQDFSLIRSGAYPGNAFYIGRAAIPELFEKVELLDTNGVVIASADYVQS